MSTSVRPFTRNSVRYALRSSDQTAFTFSARASRTISSSTIKPTLWRVPSYSAPTLPNPTMRYFISSTVFSADLQHENNFLKRFINKSSSCKNTKKERHNNNYISTAAPIPALPLPPAALYPADEQPPARPRAPERCLPLLAPPRCPAQYLLNPFPLSAPFQPRHSPVTALLQPRHSPVTAPLQPRLTLVPPPSPSNS